MLTDNRYILAALIAVLVAFVAVVLILRDRGDILGQALSALMGAVGGSLGTILWGRRVTNDPSRTN